MKNKNKKAAFFVVIAFAVFLAVFFCPKTTMAFEDSTALEIISLNITPTEVNTTEQDQAVTITIGVRDSGVGICSTGFNNDCEQSSDNKSYLNVGLAPLISTQNVQAFGSDFTRVSGDDMEGSYICQFTVNHATYFSARSKKIWKEGSLSKSASKREPKNLPLG